ncbi:hemerythrin domain-containing protein [Methylobacterium sp. E-016]|uniref:hemerythrin domain-containing protein n=1 Tax=Methylobacterium sp. E-016 TaxID=2836556 RepID=UPI001FBB6707|nr:hemerythrin domain-containing protein [Methylobacterium sp. E-016]MCJ2078614.1 hemerythrin domain-containing protein [Methylobacterium sp. E-016]
MDVWQLIGRDHANIEQLIHDAPKASQGPGAVRSRERLLGELIDRLEAHAEAVSVSLYAPLGRRAQTRTLVDALDEQHRAFMSQLADLARQRRTGSEGWLDAFEDATFLVDQYLHRHKHELIPAARALLSAGEVRDAGQTFVQAKRWMLQGRDRPAPAPRSEFDLRVIVCTLAVGLGYLLWQAGFLGRAGGRRGATGGASRGVNPATASIPAGRNGVDGPAQRRERLLDEGLEETFPASDPISAQRFT